MPSGTTSREASNRQPPIGTTSISIFQISGKSQTSQQQTWTSVSDELVKGCKFPEDQVECRRLELLFHATNLFVIREHITDTPTVRYEDCIKKAKQHERTVSDFKDHASSRGATGSSIPSFQDPLLTAHSVQWSRKPSGRKGTCGKCGRSHERGNCPAYGTKCFKCGGMNHFKQFCRTRQPSSSSKGQSPFKKGKPQQYRDRRSSGNSKGKGKGQAKGGGGTPYKKKQQFKNKNKAYSRDTEGKLGPFSTT